MVVKKQVIKSYTLNSMQIDLIPSTVKGLNELQLEISKYFDLGPNYLAYVTKVVEDGKEMLRLVPSNRGHLIIAKGEWLVDSLGTAAPLRVVTNEEFKNEFKEAKNG